MARPTALTAKTEAQLAALLACGVPQGVAAVAVGVSRRTVSRFSARRREANATIVERLGVEYVHPRLPVSCSRSFDRDERAGILIPWISPMSSVRANGEAALPQPMGLYAAEWWSAGGRTTRELVCELRGGGYGRRVRPRWGGASAGELGTTRLRWGCPRPMPCLSGALRTAPPARARRPPLTPPRREYRG